ncbi:DMT family transporter [Helicobacter equorum]|uniref:DMT family transporter n=1 Tax=Helicobacter equorum TaxID=361872 RepID=UPI0018F8347D|nr:multidrug efflux SMR transporter [Helicobacter equorum]
MSWICLFLAGLAEIAGVFGMKKFSDTNNKLFLLVIAVLFIISFGLLSVAMREITMSSAYAIWTGIGACGSVLVGIIFFKESKTPSKLLFLALIVGSSVGLKLVS